MEFLIKMVFKMDYGYQVFDELLHVFFSRLLCFELILTTLIFL